MVAKHTFIMPSHKRLWIEIRSNSHNLLQIQLYVCVQVEKGYLYYQRFTNIKVPSLKFVKLLLFYLAPPFSNQVIMWYKLVKLHGQQSPWRFILPDMMAKQWLTQVLSSMLQQDQLLWNTWEISLWRIKICVLCAVTDIGFLIAPAIIFSYYRWALTFYRPPCYAMKLL